MTNATRDGFRRSQEEPSQGTGFLPLIFGAAVLMMAGAYFMLSQDVSTSDPDFASQLTTPLSRKLLWVDFDGLRADFARDPNVMPTLTGLAARGASGIAETSSITLSLPAVKAWTTGEGFSARDMVANFWRVDPATDSIFQQAHKKQLRMAHSGSPEWENSFQQFFQNSFAHNSSEHNTAWNDERVQTSARRFAAENNYNVLVVHYIHGDMTGHTYGVKDGNYAKSLRRIDDYIGELVKLMGEDATILVIADHGATDEGYHWTPTPDVVQAPFVLAGKGVQRASGVRIRNIDIAPTVAALLGVGFPSQSEGSIAAGILDATPDQKAKWEIGYAAVRLRALERATSETTDARAEFKSAQVALAAGDLPRAVALARNVQEKSTAGLLRLSARRSTIIMAAAVILGLGACLLALVMVMRQRVESETTNGTALVSSRTATIGVLSCAGVGLVWWLAIHFQDSLPGMLMPFRSSVLLFHKKVVFPAIFAGSLAIALLTRKLRIPSPSPQAWLVIVFLAGALLGSFNQIHDFVYWSGALALGVFLWRLLLVSRVHWLDTLLYGALFISSIIARRINTLAFWYETQMGLWVSVLALLCLFVMFALLIYLIYYWRGSIHASPVTRPWSSLVTKPAWFLLAVGVAAQIARLRNWRAGDLALLALAVLGLLWEFYSPARTLQSTLLSGFLMLLATFPVLYPAGYFPVISLAIVVCAISVMRMTAHDPQAGTAAAFGVAAILFLFFALSGDMNLVVIDIKRNQLLDPEFAFAYVSIARVAALLVLQLVLPVMAVCFWLAYGLRTCRSIWLRANILMHLFFLVQIVSLVLYLQLKRNGVNSLFETLSQLILVFTLYMTFYVSALLADRMVWSPAAGTYPVPSMAPATAEHSLDSGSLQQGD